MNRGQSTKAAPSPPTAPDLPEALEPLIDAPEELRGLILEGRSLQGLDLSGRVAHDVRFVDSRLDDVDISAAEARGLALRDAAVEQGSWAGLNAEAARMERVELRNVRLTGAAFPTASLTDVAFVGCRIDLVSFRFCELLNVHFDECRLEEADFYEARLTSVLLTGCDLTRASLANATFARSELRGCRLDAIGNPERLRGTRMPMADVLQAADVLAAAVGIEIAEPPA